jgi:hypothetical protein
MANRLHPCVGNSECNFAMLFRESLHGYGRRTSNSLSALYTKREERAVILYISGQKLKHGQSFSTLGRATS